MTIRLGIIGTSPGNGHPYSWSAIFNGYNQKEMEKCGYPTIPEYLAVQKWPESRIVGARVSSIWTQEFELSKRIASACLIEHVSSTLDELKSRVDAVLLARDDAENHFHFAEQFLLAGIPIYIDKPIALSIKALNALYEIQKYPGQIFTCSALRYASELTLNSTELEDLGNISLISAFTSNSWDKYSVHLIEPVLKLLIPDDQVVGVKLLINSSESRTLDVSWSSGVRTLINTLGNYKTTTRIDIKGEKKSRQLIFKDTFLAFKKALQDFVDGVSESDCRSPFEFNLKVVELIARGSK